MQSSGIPAKFPIPFASGAGGGFVRPIPQASQIGLHDGYASLTDGFPPDCFLPTAGGGVPPFGQDMNGLQLQITQWVQWMNAGGAVPYDATFQTAIGGYPKGCVVASATTFGLMWLSTVENNTTNPDASGAGWKGFNPFASGLNYYVDTGAANALAITAVPAALAYTDGLSFLIKPANANTGATTLNVNGVGAAAVVTPAGAALTSGQIVAGTLMLVAYVGGSFQWLNAPSGAGAASASDIWAGSDNSRFISSLAAKLAMVPQTLTDASTVIWNANLGFNAGVTVNGNRTFALPTNLQAGSTYALAVTVGSGGGYTGSFATGWNFGSVGPPTFSTVAGKLDGIWAYCPDGATLMATFFKAA